MKTHIYILSDDCRGTVYGVGTYIQQMITCLMKIPDLFLHVVRFASDAEQFERVVHKEGYEEFNCLRCSVVGGNRERYYRHVWYLVRKHSKINDGERVCFLLNYTIHRVLVAMLRDWYPNCQIYLTVHYQEWCFSLNGDISKLKEIIQREDKEYLSNDEKTICQTFQEEKEAYDLVDKIICLARFTESVLWNIYQVAPEKTLLIYNGLMDKAETYPIELRDSLRRQLEIGDTEKVVLFVGRLDPIKGVKLLIRSFILLLEKIPDARLILVGDGDFSPYLKECDLHWNRILFTGRLNQERLYQIYRIADIGVLPSMHEQCSYTAIEMMMFGIPLIASSTTGLKEMIEDPADLFDMRNEDDEDAKNCLMERMLSVLNASSSNLKERRLKIRRHYKNMYTLEQMKNKYVKLFLESE